MSTLTREGAQRLRDAVECDQCLMDSEIGDVCAVHKLLHSMERQAKRWGKSVHVFLAGDRLVAYHRDYRWWDSVNLTADEHGFAYAYHVPGTPHSQVTRERAVDWLRRGLETKS